MIYQEDFNKIKDLRLYLLLHPDQEMVKTGCLHYLGDKHQEFDIHKDHLVELIEILKAGNDKLTEHNLHFIDNFIKKFK